MSEMRLARRRTAALVCWLVLLCSACTPAARDAAAPSPTPAPTPSAAPAPEPTPTPDGLVFANGHRLAGALRAFWEQNGGAAVFGAPLTEALPIDGVTMQYFERARLELRDGGVVPGDLGAEELRRQGRSPQPAPERAGCRWFQESGHNVCGALRELWERSEGATVFGPPLEEARSAGGTLTQLFRNAQLEQPRDEQPRIAPLGDRALTLVPAHSVLRSNLQPAFAQSARLSSTTRVAQPLDEVAVQLHSDARSGQATVVWGDAAGHVWPRTVALVDGRAELRTPARGALGAQGGVVLINERIAGVSTAVLSLEAVTAVRTGLPRFDELLPRVKAFMDQDISEYQFGEHLVRGYRSPDNELLWLRDHVHQAKGYTYWERDMTSLLDQFRRYQHADGSFDDYLGLYEFGVVRGRKQTEADLEYLFVEGVYRAWQATGDDEWMRSNLDAMERGLRYATSDPLRWDTTRRLVKRPYTIDTWDFEIGRPTISPDGNVAPRHWIDADTKWSIFHGDNTGYAYAMQLLARMYEHLGDSERAAAWRAEGDGILERLNALAWNGSFYRHMVPLEPVELPVDVEAQLSLSNAYALNRDVLSAQQSAAILDEYQARRRPPDQAFAEWYSIDPPFPEGSVSIPPCCAGHRPGEYVNGGIMPLVGGELAQGAFSHGYEAYGFDILQRYFSLIEGTGASYLWYHPIGQPGISGPQTLATDGWGSSAMLAGLIRGAAGVEVFGATAPAAQIAPRWAAAPYMSTATVVVRYGASADYVAYRWQLEGNTLRLSWAGSSEGVKLRVLLPAAAGEPRAALDGRDVTATLETVRGSRYLVLDAPAGGELNVTW